MRRILNTLTIPLAFWSSKILGAILDHGGSQNNCCSLILRSKRDIARGKGSRAHRGDGSHEAGPSHPMVPVREKDNCRALCGGGQICEGKREGSCHVASVPLTRAC